MKRNDNVELFAKGILQLKNETEVYDFLDDICTIKEIEDLANRLLIAKLLMTHYTFIEIEEATGASSATISRVNRCLKNKKGYYTVLKRLMKEESNETNH